jgi:clan AA aspartic protease (TIGR02281 family)
MKGSIKSEMMQFSKSSSALRVFLPALIFIFSFYATIFADIVYLKDGRKVEGLVKNRTKDMVELEVCVGGVIGYNKSEIENIEESPPQEQEALRKQWEEQRIKDEIRQEQICIEVQKGPKQAEFSIEGEGIMVEAELNNLVNVSLVLDTGATLVVLRREVADRLGIDLGKISQDVKLKVADGREVNAKYVVLGRIKVKDIQADNVEAAIMVDKIEDAKFNDGLLGMSFLRRFNFKVDHKKNKLIIEKPAEQE